MNDIKHNVHIQWYVNYIELKEIQLYAWNFKKFLTKYFVSWRVHDFWGFGCPNGAQTPCWLRLWIELRHISVNYIPKGAFIKMVCIITRMILTHLCWQRPKRMPILTISFLQKHVMKIISRKNENEKLTNKFSPNILPISVLFPSYYQKYHNCRRYFPSRWVNASLTTQLSSRSTNLQLYSIQRLWHVILQVMPSPADC